MKPMEPKPCRHVALINHAPEEQQYCDRCGAPMLFIEVSVPTAGHDPRTDEGIDKFFGSIPYDERQTIYARIDEWEAAGNKMMGN